MKYNSIRPGQVWLDTNSNRIQAHGGSIIYVDGVYYWYGENKEKTTGYLPNPSEAAIADTWHGPYTVQGDPHVDDPSHTSFHSQISSVFKVPGKKDLYIACADRWLPKLMDLKYEEYAKTFERIFSGDWREEDKTDDSLNATDMNNTSIADYVWLPLRFDGDRVYIDWLDEWRIEEYE